jgi:hypothetical protein
MMKGCLSVFGFVAGLAVLAVAFLQFNFYNIKVRYRLTVEVQDGDLVKTGSSVIQVSYNIEPSWSPSEFNSFPVPFGYAPTVDLDGKGILYVTFSNAHRTPEQWAKRNNEVLCPFRDIGCLPFAAYRKSGGAADFRQKKAALDELLRQSGPRDVPLITLPEIICFQTIDGQQKYITLPPDDLTVGFGPGVELKRVVLQLTDDPVTPRPDIWPQWLKEKGQMLGVLKGVQND